MGEACTTGWRARRLGSALIVSRVEPAAKRHPADPGVRVMTGGSQGSKNPLFVTSLALIGDRCASAATRYELILRCIELALFEYSQNFCSDAGAFPSTL